MFYHIDDEFEYDSDDYFDILELRNANNNRFAIARNEAEETEQQRIRREKSEMREVFQRLKEVEKEQKRLEKELIFKEKRCMKLIKKPSIKRVSKSMKDLPINTECSICIQTPKLIDSCLTNCKHKFCKSCLDQWINGINGVNDECPMCRDTITNVHIFKYYSPPTSKNVAVDSAVHA